MDGCTLFALEAGSDQIHLTARISGECGPATADNMCAAVASALDSRGMQILNERIFGTIDFYSSYTQIRGKHRIFIQSPFSYIQGTPIHGSGLSGIQIHAVKPDANKNPRILYHGKHACGSVWERKSATYIYIAGVHGLQEVLQNRSRSRNDQTASMFNTVKRLLAAESTDFRNVVRTWIYLEDILEWYELFNTVRTDQFRSFGMIPFSDAKLSDSSVYLPASTGIGGSNPAGAFCCADTLAVSGPVQVSVLPGMLQPSAYSYGSAFSRGICVEEKECRQIFISGTAAIDTTGQSLYPQDAEAQIRKTLEVIETLLGEKEATFKDIRSATVYLKRPEDFQVYEKIAGQLGLTDLPAVFVVADICRDELLFEMDALAVVPGKA